MPQAVRDHYRYILFFKKPVSDQDVATEANAWATSILTAYEVVPDIGAGPTSADRLPAAIRMIPRPNASARDFDIGMISTPSRSVLRSILRSKVALAVDLCVADVFSWQPYSQGIEFTYQLARRFHALVYDEETRRFFDADRWGAMRQGLTDDGCRFEYDDGNLPCFSSPHLASRSFRRAGLEGWVTMGMRKFGLPDLVVEDFVPGWSHHDLVGIIAQRLIEGARPDPSTGRLLIDLDDLRSLRARRLYENADPGATRKAEIRLAPAPDFDDMPENRTLALSFDDSPGETLYERQLHVHLSLHGIHASDSFGSSPEQSRQILMAVARARARLKGLRQAFNDGLPPGDSIFVMAGAPGLWCQVRKWENEHRMKGRTWEDPRLAAAKPRPTDFAKFLSPKELRQIEIEGDRELDDGAVLDFLRVYANGRIEGAEVARLIETLRPDLWRPIKTFLSGS
jgi:hypothetical protein